MHNPVTVKFAFVPAGEVASAKPAAVYLDVGNRLEPGIIDHHQVDAEAKCTTRLVVDYPEYVTNQIEPDEGFTIFMHHQPDIDCIGACWLTLKLLNDQPITQSALKIVDEIQEIDRGVTVLTKERLYTFYSVIMMALNDGERSDTARVERGIALFKALEKAIAEHNELAEVDWQRIDSLQPYLRAVDQDWERFEADLSRAETAHIDVDIRGTSERKRVSALFIQQPKAQLFKAWARGAIDPNTDECYTLLVVALSPTRVIISVPPDSGLSLKRIGAALQKAEDAKRKELGMELKGENRPGYDHPDPWYDGRNSLHQYTILDTPRAGTALSVIDIREQVEHS